MKIKIPKIRDNLLVYIILWNILSAVLIAFLGVPRSILYFTDALNAWLFLSVFYDQTTSFFMGNSVYSYWDYGQHYKFDITYTDNMGNKTDLSLSVLFLQLCHFYD